MSTLEQETAVVEHAGPAHAKYSASGSERWLECPGSMALCEHAPPQPESDYAAEGTEAHGCLEAILRAYIAGGKPYSVSRMLQEKHPEVMVRHALDAFKEIERLHMLHPTAKVLCETRVPLPVSEPDQFGTVDAAIVELFGKLIVIDFKYGQGVVVNPEQNSQLIYYALGLAHQYDYNFESVELMVIQPRALTDDGSTVRSWETTVEELERWRDRFEEGIKATKDPFAPLASGKWCRWCPASVICPKLSEEALEQARIDFDPVGDTLALPVISDQTIQIQHLGTILNACEKIEEWIKRVREHAHHVLERGERVSGWKLAAKRSTRKWVDKEKAAKKARKLFGDRAFSEPELLSPAQLEKVAKSDPTAKARAEKFLSEMTTAMSSGTTLVPEDDPRSAVNPVSAEFDVLEKGGDSNGKEGKKESGQKEGRKKAGRQKSSRPQAVAAKGPRKSGTAGRSSGKRVSAPKTTKKKKPTKR